MIDPLRKHYYIQFGISVADAHKLQACIEFCQQHISREHEDDANKFGLTHEQLYDFARKWSFDIRRMIENTIELHEN